MGSLDANGEARSAAFSAPESVAASVRVTLPLTWLLDPLLLGGSTNGAVGQGFVVMRLVGGHRERFADRLAEEVVVPDRDVGGGRVERAVKRAA